MWFQGCAHHCSGCQNPESRDGNAGEYVEPDDILTDIMHTDFLDGVTFTGGDPFYQLPDLIYMAECVHNLGLNLWVYTGWTYEVLLSCDMCKNALQYIDVLVDGQFVEHLKSGSCLYRGSTNQRLIDIKRSITSGSTVQWRGI